MMVLTIDGGRVEIELDGDSKDIMIAIREMVTGLHSFWCMLHEEYPQTAAAFRGVLLDMAQDNEVWDPSLADVETGMEVDSIEDLMEGWNEE